MWGQIFISFQGKFHRMLLKFKFEGNTWLKAKLFVKIKFDPFSLTNMKLGLHFNLENRYTNYRTAWFDKRVIKAIFKYFVKLNADNIKICWGRAKISNLKK